LESRTKKGSFGALFFWACAHQAADFVVKKISFAFYSSIHNLSTPYPQPIHKPPRHLPGNGQFFSSDSLHFRFRVPRFDLSHRKQESGSYDSVGEVNRKNGRRTASRTSRNV
jgi:hypothetical protein